MNYVKYLKQEIDRHKKISDLINKMNSSKKQIDIDFYKEYIPCLFKNNENFENFNKIHQEYLTAYDLKQQTVKDLFAEIDKIKKLKV